ncbi:hypothetical protein [Fimbriiglobus ruber]|uniref:Cytochrome c domain-containing protein n=1 Tax=Fimbriiglobus ruber TaxID=1908690 RepID=A0A225DMV8_9BACT|nr:hypothetical protein [Fimbriiglobus ruber]OWK37745.1 hypothetical protein FRUB_06865 [Fimbriiglobus ruber]
MRPILASLALLFSLAELPAADAPLTPEQVFDRRIKPIFQSPNPSSCVQCHLAGVDIKNYIRPSHTETFLSLRDLGLIDLDKPEKSRILALIEMGKDEKGAAAVHQANRTAEYEAFAAWVKASAADPALRSAPKLAADKLARPARPDEVIRHARKDRLVESFANTVWPMRFRCMSCHSEGSDQSKKFIAEFGDRVAWFKAGGPEATLKYLMDTKLLDAKEPAKSLLLLKPLNEAKHRGGQKFVVGDEGYKAFRRFLEDYAKIVGDKYEKAADLPPPLADEVFGTESWLKIENTPAEWSGKLLVVRVHAWDEKAGAWEAEPVATSDRKIGAGKPGTPGTIWQHTLTLRAAKGSDRAKAWRAGRPALPAGRYLVKVYVDGGGTLDRDWTATLGDAEYVGRAEVRSAWPTGYGSMTVVPAARVKKD